MVWNLLIPAVASLAGTAVSSSASKKAADAAQNAGNANIAEAQRQFDITRQDQLPFLQGGYQRLNAQNQALGLGAINYNSRGQNGMDYEAYVRQNPSLLAAYEQSGDQYGNIGEFGKTHWNTWGQNQGFQAPPSGNSAIYGDNTDYSNPLAGFKSSAFYQLPRDPKYLQETNAMFSAKGMGLDGSAQKAMFDRISNQDYNRFNDYFTSLSGGIAGGQSAANSLSNVGQNLASSNANNRNNTANALASSYANSANATNNAIGDVVYGLGRYGQQKGWF